MAVRTSITMSEGIENYPRLPYMAKVEKVEVLSNPEKGKPKKRRR